MTSSKVYFKTLEKFMLKLGEKIQTHPNLILICIDVNGFIEPCCLFQAPFLYMVIHTVS